MRSLHILVDARPLMNAAVGGVPRVAQMVMEALLREAPQHAYTLITTGMKRATLPVTIRDHTSVTHLHIPWPNKCWSMAAFFGWTSLDQMARRTTMRDYNAVLLLNVGFVGKLNTPYALLVHDIAFLIEPHWFTPKVRLWHRAVRATRLLREAAHLFCVSHTTAHDVLRLLGISRERINVMYPGTSYCDETFREAARHAPANPQSPTPHPYVIAFGSHDPRKNTRTAERTVSALQQEERWRHLELKIVDGATSDAELSSLYEHARAILYPSWYEGFGLPLHEAAQFHIPCLASAHGALPETAPRGTVLIPPTKPQLWIDALRDVLDRPDHFRTTSQLPEQMNIAPLSSFLEKIP